MLYNRMVISVLIMIKISYNSLIIINIYMNECMNPYCAFFILLQALYRTHSKKNLPSTQKIENLNPDLHLWVFLGAYAGKIK